MPAESQARPTITVHNNGVFVVMPASAPDLAARRIELELMTEYEPVVYAALWSALADDYVELYGEESINAQRCRQRASHYRAVAAF